MKVAILTQPLGHNYGGLLQAYALQTYLKKLGCEVETLDRRRQTSVKGRVKKLVRLVLGRIKILPTQSHQDWLLSELVAFRNRRLTMSPKIVSEQGVRDYYRHQDFGAFVVGSDQVWRPCYSPSILNFYLDFLDDLKSPAKRIAYAASFGLGDWKYTDKLTEQCKKLAQKFDSISVRERSAVDLCRDKLGVSAEWMVDPTLLLEPADYLFLISDCEKSDNAGCLLAYLLDPDPEKRSIVDSVRRAVGAKIFSILPEYSVTEVRMKDIAKCRFPSVESWLQAFHDAGFVVTDSFHGTVFSILFNKPFIAVGDPTRGIARFESLLSQFGLTDRLVESLDEVSPELVHSQIDWVAVNDKREAIAKAGHQFLRTQLLGD